MAGEFIKEHFLLRTPFPTAIILLSYLYIIFIYGPSFMKERKPYKLKNLSLLYDAVQICMNLFMLYKVGSFVILIPDSFEE